MGDRTVLAFDGVDLTVRRGEIVALVGPSGCGKSSLLKAVAGLEPLSRGEIRFEGAPVTGPDGRIGVMFQEARLLPWLTVRENAALSARFAANRKRRGDGGLQGEGRRGDGPQVARQVDELLARVGLEGFADAYPAQLSGGMAQRVALARTLLQRPAAILFDEPFAALDALRRMELQIWLVRLLKGQGAAALFVTHDLDEALVVGDRVAVMTRQPGRIYRIYDVPRAEARQVPPSEAGPATPSQSGSATPSQVGPAPPSEVGFETGSGSVSGTASGSGTGIIKGFENRSDTVVDTAVHAAVRTEVRTAVRTTVDAVTDVGFDVSASRELWELKQAILADLRSTGGLGEAMAS